MTSALSPRQQIAEEVSRLLGGPVDRIPHAASWRDKRFYRIVGKGLAVDVHGDRYIEINGNLHRTWPDALAVITAHLETVI